MEDAQRRFGDWFTLKIANEGTWVFTSDPDAVKQVFTGDPRLLHAGEANVVLLPVLGSHSVLLLDDDAHMAQRKLMLPAFHGERMRGYEATMAEVAARELERWPTGEPIPAWPTMQAITLEIIMRTVFGVTESARVAALGGALREALAWSTEPRRMAQLAVLGPRRIAERGTLQKALQPAEDLIYEEIRARRDASDLADRDDVLSMLLQARHEDGSPMSDKELRDELMTLLVAGHETSATALAWAVEALSRHPAALARLRDEVDGGDESYLDAVVKEVLRLRPVIALVLRRLTEPMEIGGRLLPAGVNVAPCIYLIHRRADVYEEPRAFRPERFLERPPGTYTWIPFGGGVRRCLGASFAQFEIKVVLRELVARLDIRAARPQPERRVRRAIVFAPERGGELVVGRRRARSGADPHSANGSGERLDSAKPAT
jgi:cytochrome P450